MNGDPAVMVIILSAIEHGTLSANETRRRLVGLINREIQKTDSPANTRLINECEKLLWELDTNGRTPYISHLDQDMTAVLERVKRTLMIEKTRTLLMRVGVLVTAVFVLIVFSEQLLHRMSINFYSSNDDQQFIVRGQTFEPDLLSIASAGNDVAPYSISTENYADVISYLGCDPHLGSSPLPDWDIVHYDCSHNSILGAITVFYTSKINSDRTLMLNLVTYVSLEEASLFFEQNVTGHNKTICNRRIYVTKNENRNVATWLDNKTIITLSGNIENAVLYEFIKKLYGGYYYE